MKKVIINKLELWLGTFEFYCFKVAPYVAVAFITYLMVHIIQMIT